MKITLVVCLIFVSSELVKCADILAVIPTPFFSHQATFRPLWRELAKKGHKITLITTDPMESNENITQIDYSESYDYLDKKNLGNLFKDGYNLYKLVKKFSAVIDRFMVYQFTHPGLVELVKKREKFDLMLVEIIMPGWPMLSAKFKCPLIGLSTMDGNPVMHESVGNAVHPVIYPYADLGIGDDPSFAERLQSVAFSMISELLFKRVMGYVGTKYVREYIDKDLPDVQEVMAKTDMIFINSNPIFFPPRPITPVTINLGGGLHLAKPKKLPEVRKL
ncbi:UDP-glycosyltransferase UGT4-like [Coccinella septempunctata]|uniref:UDP-glycosyltransferase UGT4-like n=1 Tax=Coccinella septempunctata TaxID=41139 RepID=UPI001D05FC32|nr:UDP-glycosyltransferase UGT4-like [Coccinella septempunctata]